MTLAILFFYLLPAMALGFALLDFLRVGWGGLVRGSANSKVGVWMPIVGFLAGVFGIIVLTTFLWQYRSRLSGSVLLIALFLASSSHRSLRLAGKILEIQTEPLIPREPLELYVRFMLGAGMIVVCTWLCTKTDWLVPRKSAEVSRA